MRTRGRQTSERPPTWPGARSVGRAILLGHLALSPLVFCRDTVEAFEFPKVALLLLTAIVLAALGLSALPRLLAAAPPSVLLRRLRANVRDPVALGFLLFLTSAVLSTVTSLSPRTSLLGAHESHAGLGTVLAYVVLFFATRILCPTLEDGRRLLVAPVVGAAGASAYALLQAAHADPRGWDRVSPLGGYVRPFGTLGHPNLLAAFLVMSLPFTAAFAVRAARRRRRLLLVVLVLIGVASCAAVLLTLSRGAWLAFACASIVLCLGWFRGRGTLSGEPPGLSRRAGGASPGGDKPRRSPAWELPAKFLIAVGLLAAASLLLFGITRAQAGGLLGPVAERVRHLGDAAGRRHLWRAGLELFRERPVFGQGLDTFQLAFVRQRTADYWQVEWNATPAKAHNEAVHVLATQGLAGAAAVLVLTAGLILAGVRAWRHSGPEVKPWAVALLAAVVAFAVQDLFSFTVAGTGTLFIACAALLSNFGRIREECPQRDGLPLWGHFLQAGVWVGALLLAFRGVVVPFQASRACCLGERLLREDPRRALEHLERAANLEPERDVWRVQLGTAAQLRARDEPNPAERRRLLVRARQAFERALEQVPASAYHRANLGRVLGDLAREGLAPPEQAFAAFDAALALDGANACFYADAAAAALALNDPARARHYCDAGLALYPRFAPLLAQRGYQELADGRDHGGALLLLRAVGADWYGDKDALLGAASVLADALLRLRCYEQTGTLARACLAVAPESAELRFSLACALVMLGRPDEARAECHRVLARCPDHALAREMLRRFHALDERQMPAPR